MFVSILKVKTWFTLETETEAESELGLESEESFDLVWINMAEAETDASSSFKMNDGYHVLCSQ